MLEMIGQDGLVGHTLGPLPFHRKDRRWVWERFSARTIIGYLPAEYRHDVGGAG